MDTTPYIGLTTDIVLLSLNEKIRSQTTYLRQWAKTLNKMISGFKLCDIGHVSIVVNIYHISSKSMITHTWQGRKNL